MIFDSYYTRLGIKKEQLRIEKEQLPKALSLQRIQVYILLLIFYNLFLTSKALQQVLRLQTRFGE